MPHARSLLFVTLVVFGSFALAESFRTADFRKAAMGEPSGHENKPPIHLPNDVIPHTKRSSEGFTYVGDVAFQTVAPSLESLDAFAW